MSNNVYITGSALVCGLGKNAPEIIDNLRRLDSPDYITRIRQATKQGRLYQINGFAETPTEKFYQVLQHTVKQAVKAANLSPQAQAELTIFIGSTSMKISTDEEQLTHLGNGIIGEFVAQLVGTQQGFYLLSTACTSSANALAYAAKMLQQQQIKRALVIGVELFNHCTDSGFESLMLLSEQQIYRPFDADSDGIILGEGCSAIVLDSEKQHAHDFQYLGSANVCDNTSETTSNVDGVAIAQCLRAAMQDARLALSDLDVIKAHATGSENNNEAEANGLMQFLQGENCPVCALKSFIGHTLGACGSNEIALMLLCIQYGFIPRVAGFSQHEALTFQPLESTLTVNDRLSLLLNTIGFSGNNTAIVLSNKVERAQS